MPIYEFYCQGCDREFEELVLRRDEVIQCPACGSEEAERLLSAFAVTGDARKAGGSACGSCKPAAGKCAGCGGH